MNDNTTQTIFESLIPTYAPIENLNKKHRCNFCKAHSQVRRREQRGGAHRVGVEITWSTSICSTDSSDLLNRQHPQIALSRKLVRIDQARVIEF